MSQFIYNKVNKIKRILITGINGFIGQHITGHLLDCGGYVIYGIGIKNEYIGKESVIYCKADITKPEEIKNVIATIKECDIIIHLAACIDMNDMNSDLIKVNCIGTYNICNLARDLKSKKIIYFSSIPVIGFPRELPITEEHFVCPETMYHITKYTGEKMISLYQNKYNINTNIFRIPSPVGVGMKQNTILPLFVRSALNNEDIVLYGKGIRKQNYIDVRDICRAVEKSIISKHVGLYNIASQRSYSNLELANKCIDYLNSESKITYNGVNDPQEEYNWDISIDKAKNELGFIAEYTLEDTIRWILEEGI